MPNLQDYSLPELHRLSTKIEREIEKRSATTAARIRKEAERLAKAAGLELSDVLGRSAPKRRQPRSESAAGPSAPTKRKPRAKYSNPADSSQKWTGRGRKPRWVEAHLAQGGALEDLEIRRQRAATAS